MINDIPIQIYNKNGIDVIRVDDLMVFLSHRKEEIEKILHSLHYKENKFLVSGEIRFIEELLKKPKYIFKD